jgi:hypothetical protein
LEVGAEGGFKLDLRQNCDPGRQDRDPGKQKLKGAVRTETIGTIIANTFYQRQREILNAHVRKCLWKTMLPNLT